MGSHSNTTLHLYKQNFKFSSAHFLIFDEKRAEKLHGHNYQVRVEIVVPPESQLNKKGFFIDFNEFKKYIRGQLEIWDEKVLLPGQNPEMKISTQGPSMQVRFRERHYAFPVNEVELLPVTNTSVEQLSRLLAQNFYNEFQKYGVVSLQVLVEETRGQGASTTVEADPG